MISFIFHPSSSFIWSQAGLVFKGFAKLRNKIWHIYCGKANCTDKNRKCNFSFKASCDYEKGSDEWKNVSYWSVDYESCKSVYAHKMLDADTQETLFTVVVLKNDIKLILD